MLADLIDDKDERLSRTSAPKELKGAVDDLSDTDRRITIALRTRPRVGRWIRVRIKCVQDRTRPGKPLCSLPNDAPLLAVNLFTSGDELLQLAFRFELDLELSDVKVLGIVEFPEQNSIDELGYPLMAGVLLLANIKEDGLCWIPSVDKVNQIRNLIVSNLFFEQHREVMSQDLSVFQGVSKVLGK